MPERRFSAMEGDAETARAACDALLGRENVIKISIKGNLI